MPEDLIVGKPTWVIHLANGLVLYAITQTKVDPDLYYHMASLGRNELTLLINYTLFRFMSISENDMQRMTNLQFLKVSQLTTG